MSSPGDDLRALGALAREAGREILRLYERGCGQARKADGSPVTEADQAAEAMILAGLSRLFPGVPVAAEESIAAGRAPAAAARFFLVDPLDGTREFVESRSGEFTVNIGLVEGGVPALGAVYRPTTGALYLGGPEGAFRAACDPHGAQAAPFEPIRVHPGRTPPRLLGSRRSDGMRDFVRRLGAGAPTAMSSSLKFCLVAEGTFDLYPRFSTVSAWDAAAGHAVLSAAGGGVMRLDGAALTYAGGGDWEIAGFVAYGGAQAESAARAALPG